MVPLKHPQVVVPIDFSEDSPRAIQSGLERVDDVAGLHVVHVLFPLDYASPGVMFGTVSDKTRESAVLEQMHKLLKQVGAEGATCAVMVGDAGLKVADYAQQVDADLIIIPSHGYHGVKRLLLGSTAERIIRHAHCSVLVVRRKDAE